MSGLLLEAVITVGPHDPQKVGVVEVGDAAEGFGFADLGPRCGLQCRGVVDGVGGIRGGRPADEVNLRIPDEVLDLEDLVWSAFDCSEREEVLVLEGGMAGRVVHGAEDPVVIWPGFSLVDGSAAANGVDVAPDFAAVGCDFKHDVGSADID